MKRKSILSVLLMLLMVVSLVGCGNKKVSTPPEVDADTTTDAQAGTEDEVKVLRGLMFFQMGNQYTK